MATRGDRLGGDAPKLLCILGVGRTGTNQLLTLLSQIPEIETRFEIFHWRRSYLLTVEELVELSRLSGAAFDPSPENSEAVRVIRSRPELVMTCLRRFLPPDKRLLVFKVFYQQLSAQQVTRAIIAQPDIAILFVRRRPIDVYISWRKAKQLGRWDEVDTTDLKIEIDADRFMRWWSRRADWYRALEHACCLSGRAYGHLTYEADIDLPPAEALRSFRGRLEGIGVTGLTMPGSAPIALPRQDRISDVARKVTNWPEFERDLTARGAIDAAFQPFPGYAPSLWERMRRRFAT